MVARKLSALILPVLLVVTMAAIALVPSKPYPACNNSAAKAELAALYDNERLAHAVDVSNLHLLSDGLKGRYCAASVK
jgi:hypothetical protein